jgi:hypothetical protein
MQQNLNYSDHNSYAELRAMFLELEAVGTPRGLHLSCGTTTIKVVRQPGDIWSVAFHPVGNDPDRAARRYGLDDAIRVVLARKHSAAGVPVRKS